MGRRETEREVESGGNVEIQVMRRKLEMGFPLLLCICGHDIEDSG